MAKKSAPAKKPARAPAAKPRAGKAAKTAKTAKTVKTAKPAKKTAAKAPKTAAAARSEKKAGGKAALRTAAKAGRAKNGISTALPEVLPADQAPLDAKESAVLLEHLRRIVRSLPETTEVEAWGHPTFRVNDKIFAGFGAEGGTASLGVKTTPDMQAALVSSDPRFKIAAYVGKHGWVELSLTGTVDLGEVEALVRGSYRLIAPARLVRKLDEAEG